MHADTTARRRYVTYRVSYNSFDSAVDQVVSVLRLKEGANVPPYRRDPPVNVDRHPPRLSSPFPSLPVPPRFHLRGDDAAHAVATVVVARRKISTSKFLDDHLANANRRR